MIHSIKNIMIIIIIGHHPSNPSVVTSEPRLEMLFLLLKALEPLEARQGRHHLQLRRLEPKRHAFRLVFAVGMGKSQPESDILNGKTCENHVKTTYFLYFQVGSKMC